jgi:integrase
MKKHLYKRSNGNYYYRIEHGDLREEKSARTKDKEVATKRMNDRYRQIEREAEGLAIPAKIKQANQLPLDKHLEHYLSQNEREWSIDYYNRTDQRLRKLFRECGWQRIGQVSRSDFLNWRSKQKAAPKTLNDYLAMIRGFMKWLVECGYADTNELETIASLRKKGRTTFERRSLTIEEFTRLMQVKDDVRRAVYTTAVLTGLRRNELMQLEWGDIHFDEVNSHIVARASTTKNGKKAYLPMVEQVRDALLNIRPANARGNDLVFDVPPMTVFKNDLKELGIAYEDDQGNRLDLHALRKSTCSLLLANGAPARVVQAIMRHSDLKLTTNTYTDTNLLPMQESMRDLSGKLAQSVTYSVTSKSTSVGSRGDGLSQHSGGGKLSRTNKDGAFCPVLAHHVPDREMVEVGGIEPPSDNESRQHLRV